MDSINTPQFRFPLIDIAKQKDNILKYLTYNSSHIPSDKVYDDLKLEELPREDFNEYIREMGEDGVLLVTKVSGNRRIIKITDKGKRFIRVGGYTTDLKDDLNEGLQKAIEEEKKQEKLDLEILSLRAGMKHNKSTRIIAILALIISGLSFLYLIFKDLILKLINPIN